MPKPRKHLISLDATPYYHCVSRCVRRAFLCGTDAYSGRSYEHRRQWVEERIHLLASLFAVDVCAYAVMSNHLHLVLHINTAKAESLSDWDVAERWMSLYRGTPLTQKFLKGEPLDDAEWMATKSLLDKWRLRLRSISWFMKALNEPIARRANAEDQCTGAFWEARFSSQALLDEKALIACMAYVDLNPIRAKMADTPENSEHTSIKKRIETAKADITKQPLALAHFVGNPREAMPQGLPFKLQDYLALVDWSGRFIREDKRGAVDVNLPCILSRLDVSPDKWLLLATRFEASFKHFVGDVESLQSAKRAFNIKRMPGIQRSRMAFS